MRFAGEDSSIGTAEDDEERRFWIIWNPAYTEPPKVRFDSEEEALKVAHRSAQRNSSQKFYVMESKGFARTAQPQSLFHRSK